MLFNKIGEKGRTSSAWKRGGGEEKEKVAGSGENWPKQCIHI
jgi:hypothetical protein